MSTAVGPSRVEHEAIVREHKIQARICKNAICFKLSCRARQYEALERETKRKLQAMQDELEDAVRKEVKISRPTFLLT